MADLDTKDSSSDHAAHSSPLQIEKERIQDDTVAPERQGFAKLYYHPLAQVIMLGLVLFM